MKSSRGPIHWWPMSAKKMFRTKSGMSRWRCRLVCSTAKLYSCVVSLWLLGRSLLTKTSEAVEETTCAVLNDWTGHIPCLYEDAFWSPPYSRRWFLSGWKVDEEFCKTVPVNVLPWNRVVNKDYLWRCYIASGLWIMTLIFWNLVGNKHYLKCYFAAGLWMTLPRWKEQIHFYVRPLR